MPDNPPAQAPPEAPALAVIPTPKPVTWSRRSLCGPIVLAGIAFIGLAIGQFTAEAAYTADGHVTTTAGKATHIVPGIAYLVLALSAVLIAVVLSAPDDDSRS